MVQSWKSWNLSFTWDLESWLTKSAKVLLAFIYLDIATRRSRKQYFWNRPSRSDLTVTSFWRFVRWNYFWLCPFDWNVDRLNMQKGSINVLSMLIFKLINLQSNRFDFFWQCLHPDVFGPFWLICKKKICWLLEHFFIPHIDGKYRSATAPLF